MKRKVVDIDVIFDNFLVDYIQTNRGKYTEKEWEEKIPVLYLEFGSTKLDELDGFSPEEYYQDLSGEELARLLFEHVENEVPVSDFLCEALVKSDCEKSIARFIGNDYDEELVSYCVNILNDKRSTIAFDKYFEMICSDETCEDMKELLAEMLANQPEAAKERALEYYERAGSSKIYFMEIFALCRGDDRVFDILINELMNHKNDIPLYLSYVTKFGDERALPYLLQLIEDEKINYVAFSELKFAIELFGGEYTKKRDFSNDKYYKKIKGQKNEDSGN
ncbi:MAG: hypothetical protein IJW13_03110 [Clostridia bacterium]|nr:hypothetical protein [Clostridia bacterium]